MQPDRRFRVHSAKLDVLNFVQIVCRFRSDNMFVFRQENFLPDAHGVERHLVACESACLIREDVVEHTQVFNYTHVLHCDTLASLRAHHLPVLKDKVSDESFEEFDGDEQRSWQEQSEDLEVAHEGE